MNSLETDKFPTAHKYNKVSSYKELQNLVEGLIDKDKEKVIQFSMFDTICCDTLDQWIIQHDDLSSSQAVLEGRCIFFIDYWRVSEEGPVYSREYENPTWKDIINACNGLLLGGDRCGVFLEDLKVSKKEKGITYVEFLIGS